MSDETVTEIRALVGQHARLRDADSLDPHDDLFQAGMTSHASVSLMLAIEDAFDVEFPDAMLTRDVFASIDAIATAVARIRAAQPVR